MRGELRLEIQTGFPGHLAEVKTVYVGEGHAPHRLESSRFHSGVLVVKLEGCDDRTLAEALRGEVLYVAERDAAPLQPGQFFYHQLIGRPVVSDAGEALGTVTEILATGANDVYVVTGPGGELLLPAIKSVILNIEPGQITVHLVEGLR
ncbi:MAG: 16S rRNA processing protein RimM [Chloroflexi bacterium]|nr:16S rRNA processing protein RimM [Chloroflexota bacterium]